MVRLIARKVGEVGYLIGQHYIAIIASIDAVARTRKGFPLGLTEMGQYDMPGDRGQMCYCHNSYSLARSFDADAFYFAIESVMGR